MECDTDPMFRDGNRVRFERPVDTAGQRWWQSAFFEPYASPNWTGQFRFDPESIHVAEAYLGRAFGSDIDA